MPIRPLPLFSDIVSTKTCNMCGKEKQLDKFHRWDAAPDGHTNRCKKCKKKYDSGYYQDNCEQKKEWIRTYRQTEKGRGVHRRSNLKYAHSEKGKKARQKHYQSETFKKTRANYLSDPEVKERDKKSKRQYNKSTKGKRARQRYAKTDKFKANKERWYAKNPDYMRITNLRRRARKKTIPGEFTKKDLDKQYASQKGICVYKGINPECECDLTAGYHIDHITPLSRPELNPTNWPDNIQLLCVHCNVSKHDKTHEEYLAWLKEVYKSG